MTKPGPHPWATNDTFSAGPDIGSDAKTVPLAAHMEDGYYRGRRPAPDILNWQLNRNYLTHLSVARLQAANYQHIVTDTTDYSTGRLVASSHYTSSSGNYMRTSLYFANGSTSNLQELWSENGADWTAATSDPVLSSLGSNPTIGADGEDSNHRIVTGSWGGGTGYNKVVYHTQHSGVWTAVTFSGGAPANALWHDVACDRDTAGNATAHWCITAYVSGSSALLWSSTDGITFSVESGFSTASGWNPTGIYHSCHPAGALGPGDAGNPIWLVSSGDQVYRSADHVTWTGPVYIGGATGQRGLAYSKLSRRWVAAHSYNNGGDISYSDDNGATWTTISNALPGAASADDHRIAGDGYGTFVVVAENALTNAMWVSVDEGLTWSMVRVPDDTMAGWVSDDGYIIEPAFFASDVDNTPAGCGFFVYAGYNDNTPETRIFRSLVV